MMWDKADTLSESRRVECNYEGRMGYKRRRITCLVEELAQSPRRPNSCSYLCPLEVSDMLSKFKMFGE